ncbi:MAG: chorismate mutase [Treponema sp.]|nr:chorismate mutase [Treponema sp.]
MTELEECRSALDELDEVMAGLFEQRMNYCKRIGDFKKANNLPVFQPQREKEIIEKKSALIKNENYKSYYARFIQNVMDLSKELQSEE